MLNFPHYTTGTQALGELGGISLDAEEEFNGADLSIHNITATPEKEAG